MAEGVNKNTFLGNDFKIRNIVLKGDFYSNTPTSEVVPLMARLVIVQTRNALLNGTDVWSRVFGSAFSLANNMYCMVDPGFGICIYDIKTRLANYTLPG